MSSPKDWELQSLPTIAITDRLADDLDPLSDAALQFEGPVRAFARWPERLAYGSNLEIIKTKPTL